MLWLEKEIENMKRDYKRKELVLNWDEHVIPENDLRIHKHVRDCWCNPQLQDENGYAQWIGDEVAMVVIHKALDGRE